MIGQGRENQEERADMEGCSKEGNPSGMPFFRGEYRLIPFEGEMNARYLGKRYQQLEGIFHTECQSKRAKDEVQQSRKEPSHSYPVETNQYIVVERFSEYIST